MSTPDKPATQPIHAVLFDYGKVLSGPPDPAAWQRMKEIFAAEEEPFHAAYWNHRDAYDHGTLNGDTYWHAVANDLHLTLNPTQLEDLLAADNTLWTQPNQPMIDWASKLHRTGVKTGILSYLGDAMEAGILRRFHWLQDFAHHTFSHRLGIAKPHPSIYHHAAAGLAVPHNCILFIDDREENVAAAKAAGMNAIQYTCHEEFVDRMTACGYAHLL